ncbi:hypothetical protein KJ973_01330 [Patescibacteria group bacterium]|nr:hypothetical protein [Patescibacteria group bacterium]MBU1519322.1 hypothetical protein [Patescibacteria group bacterium]
MTNQTIIIPKELTKRGELIIIPRREYEKYLSLKRTVPLVKITAEEKLLKELTRSQKEIIEKKGKILHSLKDLR